MTQDFSEYIDALNRYAGQSGVRPGIPQTGYGRLQGNPASMFYPNQITPTQANQMIQEAVGDTAKASAKKGITKAGLKTTLKYLPLTGDVYDISRGMYQASHGHPYAGTAQALLGVAGLATLGGGSLIKSAGKAGAKWALKKGISKGAIRNTNKALAKGAKITSSGKYQLGSAVVPELIYGMGNEDNIPANNNNLPPTEQITPQGFEEVNVDNLPEIPYVSYDEILASGGRGQLPVETTQGIDPIILQEIASRGGQLNNPTQLLQDYQQQLIEKNRPYIEGLEAYYKDYDRNLEEANRIKRYFTGLAGWTNNNKWADMANDYNPLTTEANKLALLKQLQDAKSGNIDELNRLQGNVAIANSLGLPQEAALANKDLLNAYVNQQKAQLGYNARVYDTNIDNATRLAIKQGDWDTAFKLQNMKNEGNLRNAFASSGPFYMDTQQMADIMKMLGTEPRYNPPARGLGENGLVQPSINYFSGYNQ